MADIAAGERVAVDEQSTAAHRDNHSTTTTSSGDRLLSHVEETLDHVSHQETTASPHAIIVNPVQVREETHWAGAGGLDNVI